jgi:hypothetical protein
LYIGAKFVISHEEKVRLRKLFGPKRMELAGD